MLWLPMEGREAGSPSSPANLAKLRHQPVPLRRSHLSESSRKKLRLMLKRVAAKTWRRFNLHGWMLAGGIGCAFWCHFSQEESKILLPCILKIDHLFKTGM